MLAAAPHRLVGAPPSPRVTRPCTNTSVLSLVLGRVDAGWLAEQIMLTQAMERLYHDDNDGGDDDNDNDGGATGREEASDDGDSARALSTISHASRDGAQTDGPAAGSATSSYAGCKRVPPQHSHAPHTAPLLTAATSHPWFVYY